MRLKNNKSGFTLLEIIIVIIIIGVLASLALPRLFNTIEFSRSAEALNAMGTLKHAADRCALMAGAATGAAVYTNCTTFDQVGVPNPGATPGAGFTYVITSPFVSPNWVVTATRNAPGTGTIVFTYNTVTGGVTRTGTLTYAGIS